MDKDNNDLDRLLQKALAIGEEDVHSAGKVGFMARALVQATLPHRDPGTNEFARVNGDYRLTMIAPSDIGLPYGTYPRLLMAWITTEALRTKSNELVLGRSLSEFMGELGLKVTGGRWGTVTRLRDQMLRLFSTSISVRYETDRRTSIVNVQTVSRADLWWDPLRPGQEDIWESRLILNPTFYEEIVQQPVPLDLRVLKELSRSPMALDIYVWATYRRSYLRQPAVIPWQALQLQFGAGYEFDRKGQANFQANFLKAAEKVALFDPSCMLARVKDEKGSGGGGLLIVPGPPHVPRKG